MQDDAIPAARIHLAIRVEVLIWQNFQLTYWDPVGKTEILATKPADPLIWTYWKFFKDLEVRWTRAGPVNWAHVKGP